MLLDMAFSFNIEGAEADVAVALLGLTKARLRAANRFMPVSTASTRASATEEDDGDGKVCTADGDDDDDADEDALLSSIMATIASLFFWKQPKKTKNNNNNTDTQRKEDVFSTKMAFLDRKSVV